MNRIGNSKRERGRARAAGGVFCFFVCILSIYSMHCFPEESFLQKFWIRLCSVDDEGEKNRVDKIIDRAVEKFSVEGCKATGMEGVQRMPVLF